MKHTRKVYGLKNINALRFFQMEKRIFFVNDFEFNSCLNVDLRKK